MMILLKFLLFAMVTRFQVEGTDLLKNLTQDYDKRMRPNANGPPVNVSIQIGIVSLGPFNAKTFSFEVDMYLRHWWNDPRLRYPGSSSYNYNGNPADIIWVPDTYFENSKKAHTHAIMTENRRATISPNGDVYVSMRVTATSSCPMNLHLYPMDTQECPLLLSSYSFAGNDLNPSWMKPKGVTVDTVSKKVEVSSYLFKGTRVEKEIVHLGQGNEFFAFLKCIFKVKRSFSTFINRVYVPSSFLVMLTWATFFIPHKSVPARVTLIVTNFLATVFVTQSATSQVASVDYTTALEVYLVTNVVFISITLIEYLFVLNLPNRKWSKKRKKSTAKETSSNGKHDNGEMETILGDDVEIKGKKCEIEAAPKEENGKEVHYIDNYAKIVVPIAYFLFIFTYFVYFLSIS
eukprot:Seg1305.7 transcript_id=Seg1305.7/GoldUCD/mRNA.D3Y31 product="Glycine receptor subunit alpha-3" protein_id=Seg1305.7/GoldUCD/D3Y31